MDIGIGRSLLRPRLVAPPPANNNGCSAGRLWSRSSDGVVHLSGGASSTDTVVFPSSHPEEPGTMLFMDGRHAAFRAGRVTGTEWETANRGLDSFAGGLNTTASGVQSMAVGTLSTASHLGSFVWSDSTTPESSTAQDEVRFSAGGGFVIDGDAYVNGKLNVSGIIDPTALELVGQVAIPRVPPTGSISMWSDTSNALFITTSSGSTVPVATGSGFTPQQTFVWIANVAQPNTAASGYTAGITSFSTGGGLTGTGRRFYIDATVLGGGAVRGGITSGAQWTTRGLSSVAFGADNTAAYDYGVVAGGTTNVAGLQSFVGGGSGNTSGGVVATNCVVAGGIGNHAVPPAGFASIGGGSGNAAEANYSTVAGGASNLVTAGIYASVGGGLANVVGATAASRAATISGGENNTVDSQYSSVAGGGANVVGVTCDYSTILGGRSNAVATAAYSTVLGGQGNQVNADYGVAGGHLAIANHAGAFVWAGNGATIASRAANEVTLESSGGFRAFIQRPSPLPAAQAAVFQVYGRTTAGVPATAAATGDAYFDVPNLIATGDLRVTQLVGVAAALDGNPIGLRMRQQASVPAATLAATGTLWVLTGTPTQLQFTDSAGTTAPLGTPGFVNLGGASGPTIANSAAPNWHAGANDFVFGSSSLDGAGTRFQLDKATGAFRAGVATGTQWDAANRAAGTVAFGTDNQLTGAATNSGILSGTLNSVAALASAVIAGGQGNVINTSGAGAFIGGGGIVGGGALNRVSSLRGAVGGGNGNVLVSTATDGAIVGGATNSVAGVGGFVGGGTSNQVSAAATNGCVAGGTLNVVTGVGACVPGGTSNQANGSNSLAGGQLAIVGGTNSLLWNASATTHTTSQTYDVTFYADNGFTATTSTAGGGTAASAGDVYLNGNTVVTGTLSADKGIQVKYQAAPATRTGFGTYWVNSTGNVPTFTPSGGAAVILGGAGSSVFAYDTTTTSLVRADAAYPTYVAAAQFVVGSQGLESTDAGFLATQMQFRNGGGVLGSFRAGAAATQWNLASCGSYSAAFGQNTTASGVGSLAAGLTTVASGLASFAAGSATGATADYAAVLGGLSNQVSAQYGVVCGGNANTVTAIGGFVGSGGNVGTGPLGINTVTAQRAAVLGGTGNTASAIDAAVVSGRGNTVSGANSLVGGGNTCTVSGANCAVFGSLVTAAFAGCLVFNSGPAVAATAVNQVVLGAPGGMRVLAGGAGTHTFVTGEVYLNANTFVEGALSVTGQINTATSLALLQGTDPGARTLSGTLWVATADTLPYFTTSAGTVLQLTNQGAFYTSSNTVQLNPGSPSYSATADFLFPVASATGASTRIFFDQSQASFRAGGVTGTQWDASGAYSAAFGRNSTATGDYSVVAGGDGNGATATYAVVVGGLTNLAAALNSSVLGGETNTATAGATHSVVCGGKANVVGAAGLGAFVGAGGNVGTVGTGTLALNTATAARATIVAGTHNTASAADAGVLAGSTNTASGSAAGIVAGTSNTATAQGAGVVAGLRCAASGVQSGILCGQDNAASGTNACILGGQNNTASGATAGVGAGAYNVALGASSFVAGGGLSLQPNQTTAVTGVRAFIGGGRANTCSAIDGAILSGATCTAAGVRSVVLGGSAAAAGGAGSNTYPSLVFGDASVASNDGSVALGTTVTASGSFTLAAGSGTSAVGAYSVALGQSTVATGVNSLAMGNACLTPTGAGAVALGASCVATAATSLAVGSACLTPSGAGAVALGISSSATGAGSCAVGQATTSGAYAVAFGNAASASAAAAYALGDGAVASAANAYALGGIGTTASAAGAYAFGHATAGFANSMVFGDTSLRSSAAVNQVVMGFQGGYAFYTGAASATGVSMAAGATSWASVSDRNAKENLRPFEGVLERLERLNVYEFNYIGNPVEYVCRGPVAQEWHEMFPSVGKDRLRIDTQDTDGVALAAIKELAAIVRRQSERIAELEARCGAQNVQ